MPSYYSQYYGSIMDRGYLTYLICENLIYGREYQKFLREYYGYYLAKNQVMVPHMKTYVE